MNLNLIDRFYLPFAKSQTDHDSIKHTIIRYEVTRKKNCFI